MRSRKLARWGALAVLAGVLCGTASTATAATGRAEKSAAVKVRFTVFAAATPSLGVFIADALGFFKKNNVDIEYVNVGTGSAAIQALVGGSTDFTISDVTGVTLARRNTGADVRYVSGQFTRFMGALQCRNGSGVTGTYPSAMARLVGKKVGITAPGSSTDTYLRYSLQQAGVDPSRVSIVAVGGVPNLVAAMQAGSVDCITSYQPIQQMLKGRVTTILDWAKGDGPQIFAKQYSYNGIVTSSKFAVNNPGTVRLVANAMREAIQYGSDPKNAKTIAQKVIDFFPGIETATLEGLIEDMAPTFGYKVTRADVGNAARVFDAVNPNAKIVYGYSSYIAPSMMDLTGPKVTVAKPARKGAKVSLRWSGVDRPGVRDLTDVASGVKSYDVQVKSRTGWSTRIDAKAVKSLSLRAAKGTTVRVRARDKAGNTGGWTQVRL